MLSDPLQAVQPFQISISSSVELEFPFCIGDENPRFTGLPSLCFFHSVFMLDDRKEDRS